MSLQRAYTQAMSTENPPHNRQRTREKAQKKRELDAQVEARKQAWREANFSHDPKLTSQRQPDRQIAEQFAHRIDAHREAPRQGLEWRGKPWWELRLWPLRVILILLLLRIVYGVATNIFERDAITAAVWVFAIPIPVHLLLMTFANKKV